MVKYEVARAPQLVQRGNQRTTREEPARRLLGEGLGSRQIHPILARSDGPAIDGWSRVLAARLEGLIELDVIITDESLSQSDIHVIQFTSAEHRSRLTDYEQWNGACEPMQINKHWTGKELGVMASISAIGLPRARLGISNYISAQED